MKINGAVPSNLLGGILNNLAKQAESSELALGVTLETEEIAADINVQNNTSNLRKTSHGGSSGLMARNFFNVGREQSVYVQSSIDNFASEKNFSNKISSIVGSLISETSLWDIQRNFGDKSSPIENTYVIGNRLFNMAVRKIDHLGREEELESSRKNLDAIKEEIERKAREAGSPTDENGVPFEETLTGSVKQSALPKISAGGSGHTTEASNVSDMGAPNSSAEVTVPSLFESTVAPQPSIDLTI